MINTLARADFLDFDLITGMEAAMTYADLAGIYGEQDIIETDETAAYADEALAAFFSAQADGEDAAEDALAAYSMYIDEISLGERY